MVAKNKRVLSVIIACVLLISCVFASSCEKERFKYQKTYIGAFDTVTVITGFSESQKSFDAIADDFYHRLEEYGRLYDIYQDYVGINNLKTVNDNAGVKPVEVDSRIIDLLLFSKELYEITGGAVNFAMGSVLKFWHDEMIHAQFDPESASVPDEITLKSASLHTSVDGVIINADEGTVYLSDPLMSLDVGALAKGYALERVAKEFEARDWPAIVNVGGNVRTLGMPLNEDFWSVGIKDPDNTSKILKILKIGGNCSVVTSGDYERYFTVSDIRYCHIIDPSTLYSAVNFKSVTVINADSGLADAMSTALFILDIAQGLELAQKYGIEAIWIGKNGERYVTPGFSDYYE
ncbi:MAG: FAD:protein FMN transferase [Clostridia bacterium]|nr:FAD:protein FMN transferase [Clostridia bacterium]